MDVREKPAAASWEIFLEIHLDPLGGPHEQNLSRQNRASGRILLNIRDISGTYFVPSCVLKQMSRHLDLAILASTQACDLANGLTLRR